MVSFWINCIMKKTKWLLVIIIQTKENDYGWCIWYIKKVKMILILILILIWWWWKIKMIYDGRRQKGIGCKYKGNEAQKCESRKERTEDWGLSEEGVGWMHSCAKHFGILTKLDECIPTLLHTLIDFPIKYSPKKEFQ